MTQIKDISVTRTTLDGTEWLVGQTAAGGAGSSFKLNTQSLSEYIKPTGTLPVTDGQVLTEDDLRNTITNGGAGAAITVTLPPAVVGLMAVATKLEDFTFRLDVDGTDYIRGGLAGGYLEVIAGTVVLQCLENSVWEVVGQSHAPGWRLQNGLEGAARYATSYVTAFGGDPTGAVDSTAAVQAAIDAASATTGTQGFCIVDGDFLVTGQIRMRVGCIIKGSGPNFNSRLQWTYAGADTPLVCDGAYGSGGGLFNAGIRDLTLDFSNWSGSAAEMFLVKNAYSCYFDEVVFYTTSAGHGSKYAINISGGYSLECRFSRCRRDGSTTIGRCFNINSDTDSIYGLAIHEPRLERCGRGINVEGTTGWMEMTVTAPYFESCSAGIYWETTSPDAEATVTGGIYLIPNNTSHGITIVSGDNLTIVGGTFYKPVVFAGAYTVNFVSSTRPKNIHVIGGHHSLPVYDPNNWLTTNSTKQVEPVWNQVVYNRKTTVADNTVTSLFRILPAYGSTYLSVPVLVKVTVMTYIKDGNTASRTQDFTFHVQWQNSTATSVSNVVASTATVYEVGANYSTAITASTVATAGGYVDFKIQPDSGGALGNGSALMLWAKCEVLSDGDNVTSYVQVL